MLDSYPNVFNLGHPAVQDLLSGPVLVQEKVDGSQFSFGVQDGVLFVRSKGAYIHIGGEPPMFRGAVATVVSLEDKLTPGFIYRGEVLQKPKHNTLTYSRVPTGNVILFDIQDQNREFLSPGEVQKIGESLGLEVVPLFLVGSIPDRTIFDELLQRESVLGGVPVEGVVIKPVGYNLYGVDKKVLMAKWVSPAFREAHDKGWRKENPTRGDVIGALVDTYKTEARWHKAIQHMDEAGALEFSPRDIGPLLKEIGMDVHKEEEEVIKAALFKWAWPQIQRGIVSGFPQWYQEYLVARQFEK